MTHERIRFNGAPVIGFGDDDLNPPSSAPSGRLPPLELRTAYTIKGLGIGAGGLVGYMLGGPLGMLGLGFAGWMAGNAAACSAERKYGG
jgi:hypothetical protein